MIHLIFILILILSIPDLNKKSKLWKVSFILLFLFSALRYDFGPDYMEYYSIHSLIRNLSHSWGQGDWLFKFINLLIPNFFLMIALLSFLHIFSIYILIKNNLRQNQYWFAILLLIINPYLFCVQQSSIRQTAAISLVLFAINYLTSRNLIKYSILIFLASGFHASAVIMYPIYFLITSKKFSKNTTLIIMFITFTLLFTTIFDFISLKILKVLPKHYLYYAELGLKNNLRSTILSSVFFFLLILNIHKLKNVELIYGRLSLFSTIISVLAFKLSMIVRIGMYFDIFLIISIPQIFDKFSIKVNKISLFILIMIIYLIRYYAFFSNPTWSRAYGTYKTIFTQ